MSTSRLSASERLSPRARYVDDPEPVPNSLEVREVNEQARGHGQVLGAKTKG